jgi:hypothetical protein
LYFVILHFKQSSLASEITTTSATTESAIEAEKDLNNHGKTQDLPPRRKTTRKLMQAKCRVILKKLNGLTYLLKDVPSLEKLEGQLQQMFQETEQLVKSDDGIVLEHEDCQKKGKKRKLAVSTMKGEENMKMSKKAKKVKKDVKDCLPERRYGKPRHPFAKRVGRHAEIMRKQYRVNVPIKKIPASSSTTKPSKNIIDLTNQGSSAEKSSSDALWVSSLGLRKEDEKILQSSHAWLNDSIINSAQDLIHQQFPNVEGLANSLQVASRKSLPITSECGTSIQIHHSGNMHWVVSSASNGGITVYDSMEPSISSKLACQLLHVYGQNKDGLQPVRVKAYMCQNQKGKNDCGLFAIANALALAKGICLKNVMFDQSQMRSHLHECLQNKVLTMFPHTLIEQNVAIRIKSFIIS